MTDNNLINAAIAAVRALRSYQYGNSSPDLAEEVADVLERAITQVLDHQQDELKAASKQMDEIQTVLEEIKGMVTTRTMKLGGSDTI